MAFKTRRPDTHRHAPHRRRHGQNPGDDQMTRRLLRISGNRISGQRILRSSRSSWALAAAPGEADGLSELDHALQCAYELSLVRPDDAELQVAGLVHDIGHQFASDESHGVLAGDAHPPVSRGPGGAPRGAARAGEALPGHDRSFVRRSSLGRQRRLARPARGRHVARGGRGVRGRSLCGRCGSAPQGRRRSQGARKVGSPPRSLDSCLASGGRRR